MLEIGVGCRRGPMALAYFKQAIAGEITAFLLRSACLHRQEANRRIASVTNVKCLAWAMKFGRASTRRLQESLRRWGSGVRRRDQVSRYSDIERLSCQLEIRRRYADRLYARPAGH